MLIATI